MTDLKEHLVLVTGAASGIGKQIATSLAKKGAIIAACDKNLAGLQKIKSEINSENFYIFEIDFSSESSIKGCVDKVESELGPLKAVVNCVGVLGKNGEKIESLDIEDFDLVYSINLRGAVILTKAVIKGMTERGYGRILHMASISGKEGNPLLVAYSSTKAGLIAMVKSVGKEYASSGVTVNAIAPALIESPMSDSFSESQLTYLKSKIPMNRLGTSDEVAEMAAWIISPACSFTTGFTFDLSGGRATY
ncbi:MAG: SDR family NAD(P)-dependent oxidoreductase [Candidatus Planktophila sp.]|nr:SDR family NAD(P)-dependent oxidoreductase [Candidatus Planktophila sp.]